MYRIWVGPDSYKPFETKKRAPFFARFLLGLDRFNLLYTTFSRFIFFFWGGGLSFFFGGGGGGGGGRGGGGGFLQPLSK